MAGDAVPSPNMQKETREVKHLEALTPDLWAKEMPPEKFWIIGETSEERERRIKEYYK